MQRQAVMLLLLCFVNTVLICMPLNGNLFSFFILRNQLWTIWPQHCSSYASTHIPNSWASWAIHLSLFFCRHSNNCSQSMLAGKGKSMLLLKNDDRAPIFKILNLQGLESHVFMFSQVVLQQVLYCPEVILKVAAASGFLCHITLQLPPNCFGITFPLARRRSPHFVLGCTLYSALPPLA